MKWENVKVKQKAKEVSDSKKTPGRKVGATGPGKKWGHTCNSVKGGRFLYIFGGYGRDDCQTHDIHVFDSVKQMWSKPNVRGTPPTARDSHTCTTVDHNLFVFGGTDGTNPLKDLHVLDTVTNTWSTPKVQGDAPSAREGHSAALIGTNIYIFGGCGKSSDDSEESYYNDLYILDTKTFTWAKAATSGTLPSPRDSHSMSSWNNKLFVLGGEDGSNSFLADAYVLDAGTLTWKELRTSGQKMAPRAGHTTVALRQHLFVFGGFTDDRKIFDDLHVLNVETGAWMKATTTGEGPSQRFSLAGDVVDDKKGILFFIGGCNETLEALDDMYYLETDMKIEQLELQPKLEKLSLRKELKRKRQGELTGAVDDYSPALPGSVGPSMYGPYDVVPAADRIFEAKISDVFHFGFTLEAYIDNKPLRGLLFSYKPGFAHAAHNYVSRKKAAEEAATAKMLEQRRQERKVARLAKLQVKRAAAEAAALVAAATVQPPMPPLEQQHESEQTLETHEGTELPPDMNEASHLVHTDLFGTSFGDGGEFSADGLDMDTPTTPPGTRAAVQQLVEEHMHEIVDE
ncbi:unnamed protein product [Sphagnum compactum]